MSKLDRLYDYTKFHITVYATLTTLLLGLMSWGESGGVPEQLRWWLFAVTLFFVVAGAAAGLIATNCLEVDTYEELETRGIEYIRDRQISSLNSMTKIEHASFWCGILVAVVATGLFLGRHPTCS